MNITQIFPFSISYRGLQWAQKHNKLGFLQLHCVIDHTVKSAYLSIFYCPSCSTLPRFTFVYRIYPNLDLIAREILAWHLSYLKNLTKRILSEGITLNAWKTFTRFSRLCTVLSQGSFPLCQYFKSESSRPTLVLRSSDPWNLQSCIGSTPVSFPA